MPDRTTINELDAFLLKRHVAAVPEGLAERIIAAAVRADAALPARRASRGFWADILDEISDLIAIPRPAYALACVLAVGLTIGLYSEQAAASFMPSGLTTADIASFMSINDQFKPDDLLGSD